MTGTPAKPSTNLQQAKSRLESAIERLERAIDKRAAAIEGSNAEANGALDLARAEVRELREKHNVVSTRLDAAIGRMKELVDD